MARHARTEVDVAGVLAALRAAWGDDDRARAIECALAIPADTRPRDGDPPQPTSQRPPRSRRFAPEHAAAAAAGPTADAVLALATAELGHREGTGDANRFGAWYGTDDLPWCAAFVSFVFFRAGLPLPAATARGFASCSAGAAWFQRRGRFTTRPARGLVVFYDWDGKPPLDHAGIVERVQPDGSLVVIEGDTADPSGSGANGVFRRARNVGIAGFGIPDYAGRPHAAAIGLPQLSSGSSGPDVRRLQGLLRAAYPTLTDADISCGGTFGGVTEDLVRRFQEDQRLAVDAIVGPQTWAALLGL
jgi:hypothetical protein